MTKRDNQRSRLYNAERATFTWGQTIPNDQLQHWAETNIFNKAWFRRRWGNPTIQIRLGKGGGLARAGGIITLGVGARNEWVVCHEIAHQLTASDPGHGPAFAAIYHYLIKQVIGAEQAKTLKANFRAKRVRTDSKAIPPATRFSLTALPKRKPVKPPTKVKRPKVWALADVKRAAAKAGAQVWFEREVDWRGKPKTGEWTLRVMAPEGKRWSTYEWDTVEVMDDGATLSTTAWRGSVFGSGERFQDMVSAMELGLE